MKNDNLEVEDEISSILPKLSWPTSTPERIIACQESPLEILHTKIYVSQEHKINQSLYFFQVAFKCEQSKREV